MSGRNGSTLPIEQQRRKGKGREVTGMFTQFGGRCWAVLTNADNGEIHFVVTRTRSQYVSETQRLAAGHVEQVTPRDFFKKLGCDNFTVY